MSTEHYPQRYVDALNAKIASLAAERDEAVTAMRTNARDRDANAAEFRLAREAHDQLKAVLTRITQERDRLKDEVERYKNSVGMDYAEQIAAELDAAIAERDQLREGRDACGKTMAQMAQARITIEMERDQLKDERDRLIQARDAGLWLHARPSPQRAEYELLKGYWHDKWLVASDTLRALRAELEKALNKCQQHMNERDALRAKLEGAAK